MMIVITYDVNTETPSGKRRLRRVAKICEKHGIRVQNSVFECILDWAMYLELQKALTEIIDKESDSLRFYNLGNKHDGKVLHIGAKESVNVEGTLII